MSILTIVQGATKLLKNTAIPSTVVGNSNRLVMEMLQLLNQVAFDLRNKYNWTELHRVHVFYAGVETSYPLPDDFEHLVSNTLWPVSGISPLIGPLSPQQWRAIQSGVGIGGPSPQFRIYGSGNVASGLNFGTKQLHITPPSASGEVAYEYKSRNWLFPINWQPNTGVVMGQFRSYGQNIYIAATSGTTGIFPPTHTAGTQNDGELETGVDWRFQALYDQPTSDLDVPIFDEELLIWGLYYFYLANNKMAHDFAKQQYTSLAAIRQTGKRGLTVISQSNYSNGPHFIDECNIPESGYGQ